VEISSTHPAAPDSGAVILSRASCKPMVVGLRSTEHAAIITQIIVFKEKIINFSRKCVN